MDKSKTYRVTYNVYPNDKIRQVSFHGKLQAPLYIQLIYDRRNTVYKSNLFDLFLKPKYGIRVAGDLHPPRIKEVIEREEKLVEFVINRHPDDFSLALFKQEYDHYSRDLLDEMEPGFLFYLHTFFQDEGMPHLAGSLNVAAPPVHLADVVRDLKRALKPDLYGRLVEHSFYYAPPYLPLFQFAEQLRRPLTSLTLMDWEDESIKDGFTKFMGKYYPDKSLADILENIVKYVKKLQN